MNATAPVPSDTNNPVDDTFSNQLFFRNTNCPFKQSETDPLVDQVVDALDKRAINLFNLLNGKETQFIPQYNGHHPLNVIVGTPKEKLSEITTILQKALTDKKIVVGVASPIKTQAANEVRRIILMLASSATPVTLPTQAAENSIQSTETTENSTEQQLSSNMAAKSLPNINNKIKMYVDNVQMQIILSNSHQPTKGGMGAKMGIGEFEIVLKKAAS